MRRVLTLCLSTIVASFLVSNSALAGSRNPADYPMRVQIFHFNAYSHYYRPGGGISTSLDDVDGEGQANFFEGSDVHAFDFSYHCTQRLMATPGFETYMARWKKAGRELEILLPVMGGKPGDMNGCDLKVNVKADSVYVRHNGLIAEEPTAQFKDWMTKHEFDPVHGKNVPVSPAGTQPAANPPAGAPPTQPAAAQPGGGAASTM